jgi:type IV secretion system protein VirB10
MSEGMVERGDAPELRRANPLWRWLGAAALISIGGGAAGWMALAELWDEPEPAPVAERAPRLRMDAPELALPEPPPRRAPEPEPAPEPVAVAPPPEPEPVVIPEPPPVYLPLPEPEPRYAREPEWPAPEPMYEPPPEPEQDPIEARRLSSGLGSAGAATPTSTAGAEAGERRGGLDLATTNAAMATARRLEDMRFVLPKGTYLPCILNTAIQSDQSGMVTCTLPDDIHGADGAVTLLDRGSQLVGEYRNASLEAGVRRAYVVWERVRTPTGVIVDIGSPGTGPLGRAGIGGHVQQHYWQRVGIPVLMSAVSFGASQYARDELSPDSGEFVEENTDDSLQTVMQEFARIRPTLHAHQGATIGILVARDLDMSSVYDLARARGGF